MSRFNNLIKYESVDKGVDVYKHSDGDAGYDLYTTEDIWLFPGVVKKVPLNIKTILPFGKFGLVTSRSGMSSKGVIVIPGIIDNNFRGQYNAIVTLAGFLPRKINKGTRIAQVLFLEYSDCIMMTDKVSADTNRGEKGFGSSGTM